MYALQMDKAPSNKTFFQLAAFREDPGQTTFMYPGSCNCVSLCSALRVNQFLGQRCAQSTDEKVFSDDVS